ncbi:EAL domain-containing protein [Caulobacter sp.]|uniref:putative bifunctional diguanylate cyclase/phosphodiesterase n=1 Tax=Caulobacter sp. TaxID=78 RepID=UPI001B281E8D|nr:EAL domain-containing protein [Caulobacter sp.]MBO9546968.1 GGDEF domain-containing protein [Caulobacter sp.]
MDALTSPRSDAEAFDIQAGWSRLAAGETGLRAPGDTAPERVFNQIAAQLEAARAPSFASLRDLADDAGGYVAAMSIRGLNPLRRKLGSSVADHIIAQTAERLKALLPQSRLGRVGRAGLEFGFSAADDADAADALARLEAALERRLHVDGQVFDLEVLIGFASRARHGEYAADCAADALIEAQAKGRGVRLYREADLQQAAETSAMLRDLRVALAEDALSLVYQPKLHVASQSVASAEALLRWRHGAKGWISPEVFIGLAEETGLIADITRWVVRRALSDQAWLARAGKPVTVYLNLSGRLLADVSFCAWILETVRQCDGCALGLEITETAVIEDPERALANLKLLVDAGLKIAIDDYGSGLSSLSYLKQMPAHELKIDKMFISSLTSSHRDPLLVRSTIDVAHALGMEVTAEGVETAGVLALLRVMGCDHIQGYFVSKPLELAAFAKLLDDESFGAGLARQALPFKVPMKAAAPGMAE